MNQLLLNFTEISTSNSEEVGAKIASIGEMHNDLKKLGVKVPMGFALTTSAYDLFIKSNGLDEKLEKLMAGLDMDDFSNLSETAKQARKLIINSKFPPKLEAAITTTYATIFYQKEQDVAVRSSITAPVTAAAIPESFLNITGSIALLYAVKCCYSSLYNDNAIRHRAAVRHKLTDVNLAIGIQQMVRADLACSGIAYVSNERLTCIKGNWGLGQNFAANHIKPDEFYVDNPLHLQNLPEINMKILGSKSKMLVYSDMAAGINSTVNKFTPAELRIEFVLSDDEIKDLSKKISLIRNHFKNDVCVEWAKDGVNGKLYILQATLKGY